MRNRASVVSRAGTSSDPKREIGFLGIGQAQSYYHMGQLARGHGVRDNFARALRWISRGLRRLDGVGTLDETIEILSWRQLGLHQKPIFVVDVVGYWAPLAALFEHIVSSRFAAPLVPALVSFVPDVVALFDALTA